ncbi:MAG: HEAT repeat domain-containing protein [Candidatus Methylomirabilales bacterium]
MKKKRVIEFDPRARILEKAKQYVESVALFAEEADQAIPLLLKAMKFADRDLKRSIMVLLGSFAKEAVVWPLYDMMTDPSEDEEVRHDAAVQLSVIGRFVKDPQPLTARLLQEIESADAERRLHATFALGWEGNVQAAIPLIERLYDSDVRIQQTAVNALCNLRDDRILGLLVDRLDHGSGAQKSSILFNLWRFTSKEEEVREVYLRYLEHEDPELRFEVLVCLRPVTEVQKSLEVYRRCLKDKDGRIRELALKRLAEHVGEGVLESLRGDIEPLLKDSDIKVQKAALKILKKNRFSGSNRL